MSIRETIEKKYKNSILEKNNTLTSTLRLIKSAIKDKDIEARSSGNKEGIQEKDIYILLQNLVKQRKDSIESFQKAERQDLVEKETQELNIITSFLPKQKNQDETENIILKIINENNFESIKDMGKLMNKLKGDFSGEIDMGLAGKIAKSKLKN
tara:strand:+ start:1413 stop:1874 length:462 start_codon:yes stop_codon:yes gene_type:complete